MSLTRRQFLQASAASTGALVIGCRSMGASAGADMNEGEAFDAWLAITTDDRFLLQLDKVEMGQGTATAYATLVGEELGVAPERFELIGAQVDPAFGMMQVTGGSNSLSTAWTPLRETGARAREMLKGAAADRWGVPVERLVTENGEVRDPSTGQRLRFGEVASDAAGRRAPSSVVLKETSEFQYIGREAPRVDAFAKSTGQAGYGMDVRVPGMRVAVVVHCPHPLGSLRSVDSTVATATPGVEDVFEVPGGVAVVASSYWRARTAARKLVVEWDPGASTGVDDEFIASGLDHAIGSEDLHENVSEGDVDASLELADEVVEAEYRLPYLAHATMEPMNCTVVPGQVTAEVHTGTQAPGVVQDVVAHVLGLGREQVRVHTPYLGGGFGRRAFADMAGEAAEIAKRIGKPVKLVWSREDDMARDYYRPASLHRLRGGVSKQGEVLAWDHAIAIPSLIPYMKDTAGSFAPEWARGAALGLASWLMDRVPRWAGPVLGIEGAADQPYVTNAKRIQSVSWDPGIPVGIWRSVGHSHNGFVVEGFIDELAHAAAEDPAAFRRKLLRQHARHLAVLDRLTEKSNWGKPEAGRHQGIAIHEAFGTVAGEVAEVSVEDDRVRVHKVTCVVHCGRAVNPDMVRAQMESGIIFGLTAALHGRLHFKDGAAVESNFHDHPMLRLAETPDIEVHIVPSEAEPTGVGEPGTPPIAPAVGNAIFAATGKRLRSLPFDLHQA